MTEFKSHRFGNNVEVYQVGAWGLAFNWRVVRHDNLIGLEATSEIAAIRLGLILESISDEQ